MPSGEKFDALLLMNDIATKLQRGSSAEGGAGRRGRRPAQGVPRARGRVDFVSDYERITREKPDFVGADAVQRVSTRCARTARDSARC